MERPTPNDEVPEDRRRNAAEEARTILAGTPLGSLATLAEDGGPWASVVAYATLADGTPAFSLSNLAAHGRNLERDARASLAVAGSTPPSGDPAEAGRVTLAGVCEEPTGERLEETRRAYAAVVPSAASFTGFGDFRWWTLRIEQVRWVGGFGRMDSVNPAALAVAEPDPVAPGAAGAVTHLNADHADALLLFARALAGHPDAEAARCLGADRYGLDLEVDTPGGTTSARVGFEHAVEDPGGLRALTVALVGRARAAS